MSHGVPGLPDRRRLGNYPVALRRAIGGVIGIAVGFEEMVLHPGDPLQTAGMVALAPGLVLFVGGGAAAWARAGRQVLLPRLGVLIALVVALALAADTQPPVVLTIVAMVIAAIAIIEHVQYPVRQVLEESVE